MPERTNDTKLAVGFIVEPGQESIEETLILLKLMFADRKRASKLDAYPGSQQGFY